MKTIYTLLLLMIIAEAQAQIIKPGLPQKANALKVDLWSLGSSGFCNNYSGYRLEYERKTGSRTSVAVQCNNDKLYHGGSPVRNRGYDWSISAGVETKYYFNKYRYKISKYTAPAGSYVGLKTHIGRYTTVNTGAINHNDMQPIELYSSMGMVLGDQRVLFDCLLIGGQVGISFRSGYSGGKLNLLATPEAHMMIHAGLVF